MYYLLFYPSLVPTLLSLILPALGRNPMIKKKFSNVTSAQKLHAYLRLTLLCTGGQTAATRKPNT